MPLTWHLPWASLTYYATTCPWHSPLPAYAASSAWTASLSSSKNGARNWRREASSNSCLLCSSFHLESRLAEFKHASAIISGDPYYFFWDTVEASKPDWPKLCKYGPQNKHHGTLANCSSCNHKLQNLSSRTYPGSNTEPAENPFKTTCHIFRCVNSWLALGAREHKAEPFQNTWTGELQQRPHTQWLPRTHKQEPSKSTFRQSRIKTRLGWELTAKIFANLVRKTRSETCTRAAYTLSSKFETLVKKQHILIIIIPVSNAENKLDGSIKIRFSTTATSFLATTMDGWWLASFNKHRHAKTNPCQTLAFFKNAKSGRKNRKVEVGWKWNQFLLQSKEPTSTLCFFGGVQLWEIENFYVKLKSPFQCDAMPSRRMWRLSFLW